MKRFILSATIALMLTPFASAQKPLTFSKVEIKGTVDEMTAALGRKGFKYEETNDGVPLVIGKYAGYSDVEVNIIPKEGSNEAAAIRAEIPPRLSWVKLENDYSSVKAMLTKQYGKPVEETETFRDGPFEESSEKLVSLIKNRCTFRSVFECPEGKVTLTLKHQGPICFVCVLYENAL
ncbi:MAG: hypothetical protein IJ222_01360 [Bacteroidales bacterium]|nr:hypothetical protein [Bacteroidales bacterium]